MEHARGARALRESAALQEPDARVAAVAVHLGLADDAARLYAGCGRWDQLAALRAAGGQWEQAVAVAEAHDRWAPSRRSTL
jgi:intraflagellar transport protein 140